MYIRNSKLKNAIKELITTVFNLNSPITFRINRRQGGGGSRIGGLLLSKMAQPRVRAIHKSQIKLPEIKKKFVVKMQNRLPKLQ